MGITATIKEINTNLTKMDRIHKVWLILIALFFATAFTVIVPFFLHSQEAIISITATGHKNALSKSSEVWITDFGCPFVIGLPNTDVLSTMSPPQGWERRGTVIVS